MPNEKRYDVFVSYSRRDAAWVDDFCKNLKQAGVEFFHDSQKILKPQEIDETIHRALDESRYLLLILSPNAIASEWVRRELRDQPKEKILFVKIATAPTPIDLNPDNTFDFERKYDRLGDGYRDQYIGQFKNLCSRLQKLPVEPDGGRIHPPFGQMPGDIYNRVLKLMEHVLAWPATKMGLCVMLELPSNYLDSEGGPLGANYLVHSIADKRSLPNDRACLRMLEHVKKGCALHEQDQSELANLIAEIRAFVTEQVDDEFVRQVREVIGNRYDVVKILGGSFTIVLQARDYDLKRDVIVKVLRPRIVASEDVPDKKTTRPQPREVQEPFHYFAQVAASIDHPSFLRVYGARFTEEVSLCVSEYFSSQPLAELVRLQKSLDINLIVTLLRYIGSALVSLEDAGLVHTCLNPENMFIAAGPLNHETGSNPGLRIKISPFGIAIAGDEITPITELYRLASSPSRRAQLYCGPEAKPGCRAAIQAHQFGLGLLAIEFFLGQHLNPELGLVEAKPYISGQVEAWIERSAVLSGQDRRSELVPVLRKMLDPDPSKRYPNIKESLEALLAPLESPATAGLFSELQVPWDLSETITQINDSCESRAMAAELTRASFSKVLDDGFLKAFLKKLHSIKDVAHVFERRWGGRPDRDAVEEKYSEKLRLALRAMIEYGAQPCYESLGLERVAATHSDYKIDPRLYPVFIDALLNTLEEWDPPFGVAEDRLRREVKQAWISVTQNVLNSVQGVSPSGVPSVSNPVADPTAAQRAAGGQI